MTHGFRRFLMRSRSGFLETMSREEGQDERSIATTTSGRLSGLVILEQTPGAIQDNAIHITLHRRLDRSLFQSEFAC
jgi:hypothetical protein